MYKIFFNFVCPSVEKKMALLVFRALARVPAKTKCAIFGSDFYTDAQRSRATRGLGLN